MASSDNRVTEAPDSPLAFLDAIIRSTPVDTPNASLCFGLMLHQALQDPQARVAFDETMLTIAVEGAPGLIELVVNVPALLDPERFDAPFGLYDLPAIFTTALWVQRGAATDKIGGGLFGNTTWEQHHSRLMCAIHGLLATTRAHRAAGTSLKPGTQAYLSFVTNSLTACFEVDDLEPDVRKCARDIMPTPIGIVAALGAQPMRALVEGAGEPLRAMVSGVDRMLAKRMGTTDHEDPAARLLLHMRCFLDDADTRLKHHIVSGTRVPVVDAAQPRLLEAMRAYLTAVVSVTSMGGHAVRPSAATIATLVALACCEGCGRPTPLAALLDTDVTNLQVPQGDQDAPYWALLRVALSSDDAEEAAEVARELLNLELGAPERGIGAAVAMLCALVHTRMGMLILTYPQADSEGRQLWPVATLAMFVASTAHNATLLNLATCSSSGTLELASAAKGGTANDAFSAQLVKAFCSAVGSIGRCWLKLLAHKDEWPRTKCMPGLHPLTYERALACLHSIAGCSGNLHCPEMMHEAWTVAQGLEAHFASLGEPPLFSGCPKGAPWARLHARVVVERALEVVRAKGGLQGQLAICAWLHVRGRRCYFARPLNPSHHTQAVLLGAPGNVADVRRAIDAVALFASEYERELHARNVRVHQKPGPFEGLPQCSHGSTARSADLTSAAARLCFDAPLDEASQLAIELLRSTNSEGQVQAVGTGGQASHGIAVAVLGIAMPVRQLPRAGGGSLCAVAPPPTPTKLFQMLKAYTNLEYCVKASAECTNGSAKNKAARTAPVRVL
jgi:hypothetical protein